MTEAAHAREFGLTRTHFDGVACFKDEATAQLIDCKLFTPASGK